MCLCVPQNLKVKDFKSFHKTNKRTNMGFEIILNPGNSALTLCSVDKVGPLGSSEFRDCTGMRCYGC